MEQKKVYKSVFMILAMLVFLLSRCSVAHAEETVLLKDMPIEELGESFDGEWEKEIKDPNGNYCSENILEIDASENGYVVYNLDGQYTRFSGKLVANDLYVSVGIYGDGRELYSKESLTKVYNFDIDVTGVGKLEILSDGTRKFSLEDGMFTKAEKRTVPPVYASLRELTVIDSYKFKKYTGVTAHIDGKLHRGLQILHTDVKTDLEAYTIYDLNQKYSSFLGKLAFGVIDDNGSIKVEIYLDDELAFERDVTGEYIFELVDVNLDVTNVKTMKIRLVGRDCFMFVLDDSLYLNAHTHTPGDWETEKEATCKAEGKRRKYCTVCKTVCAEKMIPKLEHHKEEDEWFEQEAPTCTSEGTRIKRCVHCGETMKTEKIPQTEHEFGKWTTAEGSVWNAPIVKKRICNACDAEAEEVKNIYTWVWVKPAVLILLFFGVLTGTTMFLIKKKGIQTISKNQRKFRRKKKREKRKPEEDVFDGYQ